MATDEEIVDLVLKANYLDSDELKEMSDDVNELGDEVSKTEQKLDQLKIDRATIQSFNELQTEIKELKTNLSLAEAEYDKSNAALKKNKDATVADTAAVKRQNIELKEQRKTLSLRSAELRRVEISLRKSNIAVKDASTLEKKYSAEIKQTRNELIKSKIRYKEEEAQLKKTYNAKKLIIDQQKVESAVSKKLRIEKEKKLAVDRKEAAIAKTTAIAIGKYEIELTKLHNEYKKGAITKSSYIKGEAALRAQFKLTEKQVRATNRAIAADSAVKRTKNTDLLTKATRRLAQAYTVLIAAQKATQAITESVKEYGELEAAQVKVQKTTDLTREQIVAMSEELQKMATEVTPTATNELLRYAEVAGQLGATGSEDILRLAAAADTLNVATDLAGDEAVTLLTRILTMTGEGVPAIDDLASVVVELGNNTATTESEIVQMTKEIVTGTTALGVGSTAAAAYGATLKELGQTGERSRSSFSRLSSAINKAVNEGGEELELLQKVTGQTADELERNLGERPEAIINDFLIGLDRLNEEGQSVDSTLGSFGITARETQDTIAVLAKNTERLERNFVLANAAAADGTKHIQEAAKAYATQDAAIAKLINKFTELKTSIGEAYSDETDKFVRGLTEAIDENKESVVVFMENMADLGGVLMDTFGVMSEVSKAINDMTFSFESGESALGIFSLGLQTLHVGIVALLQDMNEINIGFNEWVADLPFVELNAEGQKYIDDLKKKNSEYSDELDRLFGKMEDTAKQMAGASSSAYRGLLEVTEKYKGAVDKLSVTQRAQLQSIIDSGTYTESLQGIYRELTSAIVGNNRQIEVEVKLTQQKIEKDNAAAKAVTSNAKAQVQSKTELVNVQTQLNDKQQEFVFQNEIEGKTLTQLIQIQRELKAELELINKAKQSGQPITEQMIEDEKQLETAISLVNERMGESTDATEESTDATEGNTEAVEENTEAKKENTAAAEESMIAASAHVAQQLALQKQYDFTALSVEELTEKHQDLNGQMWMNVQSSKEWFGDLHDLTQAANRHQAATISQTLSMKYLQEKVESGSMSMRELEAASINATHSFDKLDDAQLDPLRAAIENARREFEALDDSINRSFDNTEDRLDELLGRESDIIARQFARELQEAQDLLDQARDSADAELIRRAQENIDNLKRAQDIELRQAREEQEQEAREAKQAKEDAAKAETETAQREKEEEVTDPLPIAPQPVQPVQPVAPAAIVGQVITVNLTFTNTGTNYPVDVLGQTSADNLLSALENAANNNLTGVN